MSPTLALTGALILSSSAFAGSPDKTVKKLNKHYAKTLGCPAESIKVTQEPGVHMDFGPVDIWQFTVDGCGATTIVNAGFSSPFLWMIDDLIVRRRVPIELDCKAEDLQYFATDPKTRIVRGCGRQITYVFSGDFADPGDYYGQWVANTVSSVPPAPASEGVNPGAKSPPETGSPSGE